MMENPPRDWQGAPATSAGTTSGTPATSDDDTLRLKNADGSFTRTPVSRPPVFQLSPGPAWGDNKGSSFARLPVVTVMSEQQFPLWFTLAVPSALVAMLGLTYLIEEALLGGDWSAGALAVGIAALVMALGALAIWGVRYLRGRQARSTLVLATVLAVVLAGGGAGALIAVKPLHSLQAQNFENQRDWGAALNEFALAGADTPNATNIARIYVEWGKDLLARHDYAGAVARFRAVLTSYGQSGDPVQQAAGDLFLAYSSWVRAGGTNMPYADAIATITAYSASAACDATCRGNAGLSLAQAHYEYGVALAGAQRYADAITQFQTVLSKYASSPFASQAHLAAAQAYLAYGKQLLTADCPLAVPLYQKLATSFGDTAQGKQATNALAAPVSVTGKLSGFPTNPAPSIYLSTQIDPSSFFYSDDYKGSLDPSTGIFTFTKVAQGNYFLNYQLSQGSSTTYTVVVDKTTRNPITVHVGPLCTVNIGPVGK
jgi:tetratricopeptide (TPR) repeat protein